MAKDIDLLAGTKRQSAYSEALLRSALSAKPAYSWGEAVARALLGGMAGHIENQEGQENAKLWGDLADAYVASQPSPTTSPMPNAGQTSALPSPRLPAIGSAQDNQVLPENPNDRVAAVFGGMTPQGRDIATRTVLGEAANQGPFGMQAVADVMKNRADAGGYRTGSTGPTTMDRVATAPGQFEPHMTAAGRARMAGYSPNSPAYQGAQAAVDNASIGGQPDVTGGSTFFYSPSVNAQLAAQNGDRKAVPDWAAGRQPTTTIGTHQFFGPEGKPAQSIGQAYAQGPQSVRTDAILDAIRNPRTSNEMRARLFQMLQKAPAEFKTIKDADGNETPVWVNPQAQTITPAQLPGSMQAAPPTITKPDGSTITMPQGANRKEWTKSVSGALGDAQAGKLTETQANATGFANKMESAERSARQFEGAATGTWDNSMRGITDGKYSPVPRAWTNWAVSKEFQQYEQAKSQFITALLRRESGAAINADEWSRYDREYFPQVGDDANVIDQKRAARQVAIDAMKKGAGPVYTPPGIQQSGGGWVDVGNGVRIREKR
jgi:hypothetical protein